MTKEELAKEELPEAADTKVAKMDGMWVRVKAGSALKGERPEKRKK